MTQITASLDGVAQVPPIGDGGTDLRQVAGMYFAVSQGMADGTHQLSIVATDGECSDGATRPMLIQVVP